MSYKIVQMCLRGLTLMMMTIALYYNTESNNITACDSFVMSGIYGGYMVVTLGLLIEAGLGLPTDKFVTSTFLAIGIFLNILSAMLAFAQFYAGGNYKKEAINKGLISLLAGMVYAVDVVMFYLK